MLQSIQGLSSTKKTNIIFWTWSVLQVITLCLVISAWAATSAGFAPYRFFFVWWTLILLLFSGISFFFIQGRIPNNPFAYGILVGMIFILCNISLMISVEFSFFSSKDLPSYTSVTVFSVFYFLNSLTLFVMWYIWRSDIIGTPAHDRLNDSANYPNIDSYDPNREREETTDYPSTSGIGGGMNSDSFRGQNGTYLGNAEQTA